MFTKPETHWQCHGTVDCTFVRGSNIYIYFLWIYANTLFNCAGCCSDWYRLLPASPSRVSKGNLCHHGLVLVCLAHSGNTFVCIHSCMLVSLFHTTAGTQTITFGPHLTIFCMTWWQMSPSFFRWTLARKALPSAVDLASHWSVARKCIQNCRTDTIE